MCDPAVIWNQLPEWLQVIIGILGIALLFVGAAGQGWAARELASCEAEAAELEKNPDLVCKHIVPTEEARAKARARLAAKAEA